jgi:formamidopyrimidine-DNA glycosylase
MPELPEVETVMRGLDAVMRGERLVRVEQRRPNLRWPFPDDFVARLEGRTAVSLARRAKYIVVTLDSGEVLISHLGMSGRFTITPPRGGIGSTPGAFTHSTGTPDVHDHVVFGLSNGAVVTYNDPRRFGLMDLVAASGLHQHKLFAGLGVEPLSPAFDATYLAARADGRGVDLKAFLMDQKVVAGLGNIYVSEALWRARLLPTRMAVCLASGPKAAQRAAALVKAVQDVLAEAIAAGGSTLRDYRQASGDLGYFQKAHAVYDREELPCVRPKCAGVIRRAVQAGRSTYFCARCQQ